MPDVNDTRFTQQNPQLTTYVEQLINEVRRVSGLCTSPTAQQAFHNAIAALDLAWLIEKQGGVIATSPDQQAQQLQMLQQYGQQYGMQQRTGGFPGVGPSNAGR